MAWKRLGRFAGGKLRGQFRVEVWVEFGKRCSIDKLELQRRPEGGEFASPFIFRNYRERAIAEERGHDFLRVAGALACDPKFVCYGLLLMMAMLHRC